MFQIRLDGSIGVLGMDRDSIACTHYALSYWHH